MALREPTPAGETCFENIRVSISLPPKEAYSALCKALASIEAVAPSDFTTDTYSSGEDVDCDTYELWGENIDGPEEVAK